MYLAEILINPLFTDVAFRRDSEGDGSGHYESGGVMYPPSLVPSARLVMAAMLLRSMIARIWVQIRSCVPVVHTQLYQTAVRH